MKSYTTLRNQFGSLSKNSSSTNLALADILINDSLRYLTGKFPIFNERAYTVNTVAQQQFYNLPPQVKRLINVTVSIGSVLWLPKFAPNRDYWDSLNVITFYQDFPSFFYVFNSQMGLFPIPASSGNPITMNYQVRTTDLSMADVTQTTASATMSATNGSTTLTASGATFLNWMVNNWIQIPETSNNATSGDGKWYQIDSVTSSTVAVLKNKYTGPTVTGASFTIGEMPILSEDYQDLPLYRALWIYFNSIVPNPNQAKLYKELYDVGYVMLNDEYGDKTTSPVLTDTDAPVYNPNLFVRSISQI